MSEYYAVIRSTDHLAHYGVKGMKWGVRKFAKDKYARPSEKFMSLYGKESTKKVGPRTMQRHFNSLDQSYANINQHQTGDKMMFNYELNNLLREKTGSSGKLSEKRQKYYSDRFSKITDDGRTKETQKSNIEAMQDAIAAKAANYGYSVKSKPITRYGTVGIQTPTKGQKVKIRKNKGNNAQTTFTMYKENGDGTPYNVNLTTGSISSKKKKHKT